MKKKSKIEILSYLRNICVAIHTDTYLYLTFRKDGGRNYLGHTVKLCPSYSHLSGEIIIKPKKSGPAS